MFGYKGISMISLNFTNRLTKIATFLKDWKAVINTGSNHGIMTSPSWQPIFITYYSRIFYFFTKSNL